jgi:hypothetical protein
MTPPASFHWVCIAALVAGATALVSRVDPKPGTNLARHAKVTLSSNDGTIASAAGAVDGDIWNVGFRTEAEPSPWVLLDLGASKRLSRFVIYNCYDRYPYPAIRPAVEVSRDAYLARVRFDCRQEEGVPLVIETSQDGRHFTEVARQNNLFELWSVPVAPRLARYVRLRLLRVAHLQLREIEAY